IGLTTAASFPQSLDGMTLNVQGNFEAGRNCSPIATSVKDLSVAPVQAETGESTTRLAVGSSTQKASSAAPAIPSGGAAGDSPSPAAPPPPAASPLPPVAPMVTTSFRPSLPDPPTG
ncbi:MAG: hypothetical protein WD627_12185, partial [Actinomycetota bacterium]